MGRHAQFVGRKWYCVRAMLTVRPAQLETMRREMGLDEVILPCFELCVLHELDEIIDPLLDTEHEVAEITEPLLETEHEIGDPDLEEGFELDTELEYSALEEEFDLDTELEISAMEETFDLDTELEIGEDDGFVLDTELELVS